MIFSLWNMLKCHDDEPYCLSENLIFFSLWYMPKCHGDEPYCPSENLIFSLWNMPKCHGDGLICLSNIFNFFFLWNKPKCHGHQPQPYYLPSPAGTWHIFIDFQSLHTYNLKIYLNLSSTEIYNLVDMCYEDDHCVDEFIYVMKNSIS